MLNLVANGPSGYTISNSLRFRVSASAYLNRTPASASNRTTYTLSTWVKRGKLGDYLTIFGAGATSPTYDVLRFNSSDQLEFFTAGAASVDVATTQVFRDPSAWYHIVLAVDTTQATAANRVKFYINGSQVTAFASASYPTQNSTNSINNTVPHAIGATAVNGSFNTYFDGYNTEVNFIDGQALTPSSFGSTNATTGVWQPAKYTGTYGTNGFYLNFNSIALTSGSNTGLGKDSSGNGNYWTTNNISVTAGTTYDAMTDVPTLTSATVANYATLNPLRNTASSQGTFSNANLRVSGAAGATNCVAAGTMTVSYKMYWEMTITTMATASSGGVGIVPSSSNQVLIAGSMSTGIYYLANGNKIVTGTSSAYGSSYTSGDVIGIAVDTSAETVTFYKNNTSQGSISGTGVISLGVLPFIGMDDVNSPSVTANFGQQPFTYTPPTGFVALNTFNLSTPTILQGNKYMDATTYTGTGASLSVTNTSAFKPDLVWIKSRSAATDHKLTDSVRGVQKGLISDTTGAETTDTNGLTAFNSNGWSLGTDTVYNNNAATYVGWQWQAGQGSSSSNTSGSITSTVSVNTTAGFSIVTYTGTSTAGTIGHGLGVAPKMIIVKPRSATGDWIVYTSTTGAGNFLLLDTTAASAASTTKWNNTAPTSSVFSVGIDTTTNFLTTTYVAYCWAEIAGFSKFGSYTGNGSTNGPFVYLGFRPKYVMLKVASSGTSAWTIYDTTRNTYNVDGTILNADQAGAEITDTRPSGGYPIDIVSNGFKIRHDSNDPTNGNGYTIIYACWAENPFKNALAR